MSFIERPLRDAGNEGNPNKAGDFFQLARMGDALAGGLRYARGTVTGNTLTLPAGAKAHFLAGGFIIAATGGVGPIDAVDDGVSPLVSGQAQVTPAGDIAFFATDAVTEAEVFYRTLEQVPITLDIVVNPATGVGDLGAYAGVRLLAAEALTGTVTGVATVIARAGTPATTEAALSANGESVQFLIADAVSSARVTFLPQPGFGPSPAMVGDKMDVDGSL